MNINNSPNIILSKFKFLKISLSKLGFIKENHLITWDSRIIKKNITKLEFSPNSIDHIYSSHFLEHVYLYQAKIILHSCYKMLKKGGKLRLALPDYDIFIDDYISLRRNDPYSALLAFEQHLLSHPLNNPSKLEKYILKNSHIHKWHPTKGFVIQLLKEVGFTSVTSKEFRVGEFPDLLAIENRSDKTFYVEATK